MMIVVMLGYLGLIAAPQGAFVGLISFILMGLIGNQVWLRMT